MNWKTRLNKYVDIVERDKRSDNNRTVVLQFKDLAKYSIWIKAQFWGD